MGCLTSAEANAVSSSRQHKNVRMVFTLFLFGRTKVRGIFLGEPFFQFRLGRGVGRVIGEVLPLVRVFGGIVELFTAAGVHFIETVG